MSFFFKVKKKYILNKSKHRRLFLSAIRDGDVGLVKYMIALGFNKETRFDFKRTPLMLAIRFDQIEMVRTLLDLGVDIEARDSQDNTALIYAATNGRLNSLLALLAHKPNLNVFGKQGMPALYLAFMRGHLDAFCSLLNAGANTNQFTSPLFVDAFQGNAKKVSIDLVDEYSPYFVSLALILAAFRGHETISHLLLEAGADKEYYSPEFKSALYWAKQRQHLGVQRVLGGFALRLEQIGFSDELPTSLVDPISMVIMNDPVTVSSGQTYDRQSLVHCFKKKEYPNRIEDPLTRLPIYLEELKNKTNIIIKNQIEAFVLEQENKYHLAKIEQSELLIDLDDIPGLSNQSLSP